MARAFASTFAGDNKAYPAVITQVNGFVSILFRMKVSTAFFDKLLDAVSFGHSGLIAQNHTPIKSLKVELLKKNQPILSKVEKEFLFVLVSYPPA